MLHVLAADYGTATTHVGPERTARNRATRRCDVASASAADLMAENATDHGAGDRATDIGPAAIGYDILPLDPAPLLGRSDDRMNG